SFRYLLSFARLCSARALHSFPTRRSSDLNFVKSQYFHIFFYLSTNQITTTVANVANNCNHECYNSDDCQICPIGCIWLNGAACCLHQIVENIEVFNPICKLSDMSDKTNKECEANINPTCKACTWQEGHQSTQDREYEPQTTHPCHATAKDCTCRQSLFIAHLLNINYKYSSKNCKWSI